MENTKSFTQPVEIWGGIECTVNRVGEQYFDQLVRNGHDWRVSDLDRFAELGISTIRYPVLWERVAPFQLSEPNWQWSDERLLRLKALNINPIVGLVHHGSGPRYASMEHENFVSGLAQYARMVAERYPWVDQYTPVNEPLTTARFCGLYGFWHPHTRNVLSFLKILVHECKGTVLAMQEIRKVNPQAKLVQTEDLGQTHSTPLLQYQATFENERRWLSFDLLCGRVKPGHKLWKYLIRSGLTEKELSFFWENPCPPDSIGINHYLTSERYLDERLKLYPKHTHGGNGRHAYSDVEAIRIPGIQVASIHNLLKQVWERYQIPIAITEVHLGCTREDQLRWFHQVWQTAKQLKQEGVDLRAVTAWALLGSYDWNSLLQHSSGYYESGVYDLRSPEPRPTALAHLVKEIAQTGQATHPVLEGLGWWQREDRWMIKSQFPNHICASGHLPNHGRPVLITGAAESLGQAFGKICRQRGIAYRLFTHEPTDIANLDLVKDVLREINPWAVINAAGYVRTDQAEEEPERCYRENVISAATLAEACRAMDVKLLSFSSDLVFDGRKATPYRERDVINPQGVYGMSKAVAERKVLSILPSALVVRTGTLFGPWDEHNFAHQALVNLLANQLFEAAVHWTVSPTYLPDLVRTCLDLLIDSAEGIWHLTNKGEITLAEFARMLAIKEGIDPSWVDDWYGQQYESAARQSPVYTALDSEQTFLMPPLEDAIRRYLRDSQPLKALVATKNVLRPA